MPEDRHAVPPLPPDSAATGRRRSQPLTRAQRWLAASACAVALLVALGVGHGYWTTLEEHWRLASTGVATDGTIVSDQEVQYRAGRTGASGASVAYTPTFRYRTAEGRVVEGTVPESLPRDEIRPGRIMRVVYDPANPTTVRLASAVERGPGFFLWLESGLLGLFIALLGVALLSLLFQRNAVSATAAAHAAAPDLPETAAAGTTARRWPHRVACALGLLIASGFAFAAWAVWDDHRSMTRAGIATDGTILRHEEVRRAEVRGGELRRGEEVTYRLTVRFRTTGGETVEGTAAPDIALPRAEVEPGRVMRVVYDPANPADIRLATALEQGPGAAPWMLAGFALAVGVPCAVGLFRRRATTA